MASFVRGFKFPFQKVGRELPAPSSDELAIEESLRQLISTPRRARLMRKDLGTGAYDYVFEPNTPLMVENLRTDVMTAVGRYETRVLLTGIDAVRDLDKGEVVLILNYIVRATQQPRRFTLPIPADTGVS